MNPEDREQKASERDDRADKREIQAEARDDRAGVREERAEERDIRADVVETYADHIVDIIVERESYIKGSVKLLLWLVAVLIIISIGNMARSFIVQNSADESTRAAERVEKTQVEFRSTSIEARDAARESLAELRRIIARFEQNNDEPDLQNQAIIEALQAVARIEAAICGGICPEPP